MEKRTLAALNLLRDNGIKPSPQRLAIYNYLCEHNTHPSVETVYGDLVQLYPTLSRTTVYQTLVALCEKDLAQKLTIEEGTMRFDATTSDHGHFRCTKCRRIFDFSLPKETQFPHPQGGFSVHRIHLYEYGICPECQGQYKDRT